MRKLLATVMVLVTSVLPLSAQMGSVPYVFTSGTAISSAQVNANFSSLYSNSLNRTGGTMTGSLTTLGVIPGVTGTYDLGGSSNKYRDFYLSRNAAIGGATAITGTLDVTGATTLTGVVTASTGLTVSASGLTVTGLTTLNSGLTVPGTSTLGTAGITTLTATGATITTATVTTDNVTTLNVSGSSALHATAITGDLTVSTTLTVQGTPAFGSAVVLSGANSDTLVCDGATTDHVITIGITPVVSLTTAGAGSTCSLKGMAGGSAGQTRYLLNNTGFPVLIVEEDVSATTTNRFQSVAGASYIIEPNAVCFVLYSAVTSRWVPTCKA